MSMQIGEHHTHELADCYPLLEGDQLAQMVEDIKANGLREGFEIVLFQERGHGSGDLILDGRNRYRACLAAKVAPRFTVYDGPEDIESLTSYVVSVNHTRRNLDSGQGAVVARRLGKIIREHNKRKARQSNLPHVDDASAGMADAVLADGVPELVAAVDRGDVPLAVAAAASKLEPDRQRDLVARVEAQGQAEPSVRAKSTDEAVMSTAIRLTPVDVVGLRSLVFMGDKNQHAEVRHGADVLRRIVAAVGRKERL